MEVDLVYLWVDDSDPKWKAKKNKLLGEESFNKDSIDDCRFKNNDELKYSLRSVEKYAPWINNIYVVTDNQIPEWLNTDHPKIKIVDHKEILPAEALPTFNAYVIEYGLPFIKGLSENFLFANDDMFIWNEVDKDFFFKNGKPICRLGSKIYNKPYRHIYGGNIVKTYKMMKEKYGIDIPYFPHHNIDAYNKTLFKQCIEEFKDEYEKTLKHNFREMGDLSRMIVSYYSIYKDGAEEKHVGQNWLCKLLKLQLGESCLVNLKQSSMQKILKSKAKLMCINDTRKTTDNDRKSIKAVLEKKFPKKSEYER